MKAKDVLKDLGPKALVQIYKPKKKGYGYEQQFLRAYSVEEIQNLKGCTWIDHNLDKDIDHVEYGHYYTTDEFIGSCNIYLKAEQAVREEKPTTIDYTDLKEKWDTYREQMRIHDDFEIKAWMVSAFLNALSEGMLNKMEDKDLS